jgi:hypothetical protein
MSTVMTVVSIVALFASLAVLWGGVRRFEFGSFTGTVMSIIELLGIAVSVVSLRWVGLVMFIGANVIAIATWSVILAVRQQTKLTYASTLCGETPGAMYGLAGRLRDRRELRNYGPIAIADLIVQLAGRNRSLEEIESMAVPIAMLKTIHDVPLDWLVDRLDQIMRLSGETDPNKVADIVHNTTTHSPMSFREALDALVAVYGGDTTAIATAA